MFCVVSSYCDISVHKHDSDFDLPDVLHLAAARRREVQARVRAAVDHGGVRGRRAAAGRHRRRRRVPLHREPLRRA